MKTVPEAARAVAALLRFQGELGLVGLDEAPSLAPPAPRGEAEPDLSALPSRSSAVTTSARRIPSVETLEAIREDLGACTRCPLAAGRTNIVFGVGDPAARLMFVGEAPGRDEDLQGEPFVGAAGQLLDRMIEAMGLQRRDVYIANIVKCRPPRNRNPDPEEMAACGPFVRRQIAAVRPEALVALGRIAAHALLNTRTALGRMRGRWHDLEGIPLMPTFHPAYLLRNPADKRLVWQDLQAVMNRLQLKPPASR